MPQAKLSKGSYILKMSIESSQTDRTETGVILALGFVPNPTNKCVPFQIMSVFKIYCPQLDYSQVVEAMSQASSIEAGTT